MKRETDELLAAYVDGVSELSSAERERVEAQLRASGELRAEEMATRNLLGQLRELGTAERETAEPALDWASMERSIRDAVGPDVPRPWWRRWRWLVPGVATLAAATAILALVVRAPSVELGAPPPVRDASVAAIGSDAPRAEDPNLVWLDGTAVELGPEADDALDALEVRHLHGLGDSGVEFVVSDLRWVDTIDDDSLDGVENELEAMRKKKG